MNRASHQLTESFSLPQELSREQLYGGAELVTQNNLSKQSVSAPHTTFAPLNYQEGYAYPLIIWLHGTADNEHQLRRVMPLISMQNFVAVAPRAPRADPLTQGAFLWEQTPAAIETAEHRVYETLDAATDRFNIHHQRVFLAGYGQGGSMALRLALSQPQTFAGGISIGGNLPTSHNLLRNINHARGQSLMLLAQKESDDYPADQVCNDLRLLHSAGLQIELRQYPCGDELTTKMLDDVNSWVMNQISSSATIIS